MIKTAIGIPIVDHIPGEVFPSLARVIGEVSRIGDVVLVSPLNQFPHDRPRNLIVEKALDSSADYLFFIDSDMMIPSGAFQELRKGIEEGDPRAFAVSGYYLQRGYPFASTWTRLKGWEILRVEPPKSDPDRFYPIDACGMGCCLIDLQRARKIPLPWFRSLEISGQTAGEDSYFCSLVRENGGVILGATRVSCGHLFTRTFITPENALSLRREHLVNKEITL